jgi:hypothetical protein
MLCSAVLIFGTAVQCSYVKKKKCENKTQAHRDSFNFRDIITPISHFNSLPHQTTLLYFNFVR